MFCRIVSLIVLFVLFSSCKQILSSKEENLFEASQTENNIKKANQKKKDLKLFLEMIKTKGAENLPIEEGKHFFYSYDSDLVKYEGFIRNQSDNLDKNLILKGNFVSDTLVKMFPVKHFKYIEIDSMIFYKKLLINENINAFVVHKSIFLGNEAYLKIIFTYNSKTGEYIDSKYISISGAGPSNWTYTCGFYINENHLIKTVSHLTEEDLHEVIERKLKINNAGEINIIDLKSYEVDTKKQLHDYKNDFEEREIPKITKEEKATLFKDFIKAIPEVSLPYNSKEFYSVMQIGSPEIGKPDITLLHHNKLSLDPNVKYFFSNSANDTAFKVIKNDYKEDYYFYPVAKFPIANENMAILYVYQSFCNYNPAIYVRLNTYDSNGNILATKILDRRFYNGVYRFLSSIQIEKDLKINSKQFIQNYEDYEYGDESYKEKAPEINKITYQIKANGFIE